MCVCVCVKRAKRPIGDDGDKMCRKIQLGHYVIGDVVMLHVAVNDAQEIAQRLRVFRSRHRIHPILQHDLDLTRFIKTELNSCIHETQQSQKMGSYVHQDREMKG
jgi:hypothetical protein